MTFINISQYILVTIQLWREKNSVIYFQKIKNIPTKIFHTIWTNTRPILTPRTIQTLLIILTMASRLDPIYTHAIDLYLLIYFELILNHNKN